MNRTAVRITLILGILSIIGILVVQFYFVQKAFNQEDHQLNQSISVALREVAEDVASYNNADSPHKNPVERQSPDYYIVNINGQIDPVILEHFLIQRFTDRGILLDFEYGIYDCQSEEMVYGSLVRFGQGSRLEPVEYEFAKHDDFVYYFGIHFPGRSNYLINSLGIWYFFSFILLLVIVFFGYTQIIILRQRRYTEVQRDFINTMTHEFKTPLASLSMAADVIRDDQILEEPGRLKQYGIIIRKQVDHLLNQVQMVLESGGAKSGKFNLNRENLTAEPVLEEVLEQMSPQINASHALVKTHWESNNAHVMVDPKHLSNILINLLDNSLKYASDSPEIHIATEVSKHYLEIRIQDNGIGIAENYQKRVFEKFFRVPTGNIHDVKGFGLGLYYVHNAVKAHGGKISMLSEEKEGTTITIKLPLIK